jgi:type IV pilus assembly protein PilZ
MTDRPNDRARGDKRFQTAQRLQVRCQNWSDFAELYASDVSQGGMFIETTNPLPILSELQLELSLPEGHLVHLNAVVVHVLDVRQAALEQRPPGVGVQFVDLEPERKRQIQQLVEFARRPAGADGTQSLASHMFESTKSIAPGQLFTTAPAGEPARTPRARKPRAQPTSRAITARPGADTDAQITARPSVRVPDRSTAPPGQSTDATKLKLGMTYLAHRDFDAAIKAFSEAAQDSGANLEAQQWLLLAKARRCLHEGDPNAACEHYQNVLNIDEANHEARKFVREHHGKRRLQSLPFGRFFVKKS